MTMTWIPDGNGVQRAGDVGGDTQRGEAYSVCYRREADGEHGRVDPDGGRNLFSMVTLNFYAETRMEDCYDEDGIAKDSEGAPILWLTVQTETMVATGRDDPGGTEVACDLEYVELGRTFATVADAEAAARKLAELYANDAELFNRDIDWNGLASWEPGTNLPPR